MEELEKEPEGIDYSLYAKGMCCLPKVEVFPDPKPLCVLPFIYWLINAVC